MSVAIQSWQNIEVPGEGARLAEVVDGMLHIWPGGKGNGPLITMPLVDWARISKDVRLAYMRADVRAEIAATDAKLAAYTAREGAEHDE